MQAREVQAREVQARHQVHRVGTTHDDMHFEVDIEVEKLWATGDNDNNSSVLQVNYSVGTVSVPTFPPTSSSYS